MAPESIQGIGVWKGEGVGSDASISTSILGLIEEARAARAGAPSQMSSEEATELLNQWNACKRNGTPFSHEQRLKDRAGRAYVVQSIVVPVQLETGDSRYVGFNIDVSDRSQATAERDAAIALLQSAAERDGFGTWELDLATDRFEMNAVARDLMGLPQSMDVTYSSFVSALSSADRGALAMAITHSRATKEPTQIEFTSRTPLKVSIVATEFGLVLGEMRDMESGLRRALEFAELSSNPTILYDKKLYEGGRNSAATHTTDEELAGTESLLTQCLLSGQSASKELNGDRFAKASPWADGVILVLQPMDAAATGSLVSQIAAIEPARQLDFALGGLVRSMPSAPTPVVVVEPMLTRALEHVTMGMAELESVPKTLLSVASDRLEAGERQALIRHMQALSRTTLTVDRLRLWGGLSDVQPVREVVSLGALFESDSRLRPFSWVSVEGEVSADRELLTLALVELLRNATNFAAGAATAVRGAERTLTFADAGAGFPVSVLESAVLAFVRGRNADTVVGDGLGLSICDRIVRAHGGSMTIRNLGGARIELSF